MRVLVIEDEKKLAGFIRRALREEGYAVDVSHDGDEGAHYALTTNFDAILLDLRLPGRDGLSILRELRAQKKTTPVIILSVRDTVEERVLGLDEGADDYLVKPFSLDELRARLRALLRRGKEGPPAALHFADLSMNLLDRKVMRGNHRVRLTAKEFALLEFLLRNPGRVLTRASIAEHVWSLDFHGQSNVIDVLVRELRAKTETHGGSRLIHTVRGVGYVLREGEEPAG